MAFPALALAPIFWGLIKLILLGSIKIVVLGIGALLFPVFTANTYVRMTSSTPKILAEYLFSINLITGDRLTVLEEALKPILSHVENPELYMSKAQARDFLLAIVKKTYKSIRDGILNVPRKIGSLWVSVENVILGFLPSFMNSAKLRILMFNAASLIVLFLVRSDIYEGYANLSSFIEPTTHIYDLFFDYGGFLESFGDIVNIVSSVGFAMWTIGITVLSMAGIKALILIFGTDYVVRMYRTEGTLFHKLGNVANWAKSLWKWLKKTFWIERTLGERIWIGLSVLPLTIIIVFAVLLKRFVYTFLFKKLIESRIQKLFIWGATFFKGKMST